MSNVNLQVNRLGEVDLSRKPEKAKLYLCKPDKKPFKSLFDIYDVQLNVNLGKVNEVVFTIPSQIERNHQLIDNPLIEVIRHRYIIQVEYNNITEYFIHFEQNKRFSENEETITYTSYSTGYMLADKDIRGYKAESKNLTYMATDILGETNWAVGYVDADFDLKFRQHEISSQNVLQAIYELAEKFNAVIVWDTVNLRVNFYKPQNVGLNRGFRLREGKYLESFDYNSSSDEMPTRLKLYGSEGLSIRRLTPTGMNYIEDFSYYIYPFKRDDKGNVIQHSHYMSDELCIALEKYNKVLDGLSGQFDTLTEQLKLKQDDLQQRDQEMSLLKTELEILLQEKDVSNTDGKGGTPEHTNILNRISAKEGQISTKQSQITTIQSSIESLNVQLATLRTSAKMETHLTREQLLELNNFIITKEHTNDSIINDEDLLEEGIEVFMSLREPKVNLTLDLVNFLSIVEAQNDWDKLGLGDTVTLESKRLGILITAKIIGISYNFENDSISLTIANEKEIQDSDEKLAKMLNDATKTSTIVNMDKFKWDMVEDATNMVSQLLNKEWDATKQAIIGGYKQSIMITERGLIIKSPSDPMSWLVAQNGVLAITNDNGNTWKTAISKNGVHAERIVGKLILGNQLIAEDENGIIRISGSLQEVFDPSGKVKVALGQYEPGKYGARFDAGALEIIGGLTENQLSQTVIDKFSQAEGIRTDLRMTAPLPTNITLNGEGITATVTGNANKFARMDYRGLYIQGGAMDIRTSATTNSGVVFNGTGISAYNSSGNRTFYVDTNGNLTAQTGTFGGSLNAATGTFSGNLSAASGTFRGDISGATGTFSGNLSGASGTFRGDISGSTGTFGGTYTGTLDAEKITGNILTMTHGSTTLQISGRFGNQFIESRNAGGFAIRSDQNISLQAGGGQSIFVGGGDLRVQGGLNVESGVTQFYPPNRPGTVTINGTLNVTSLNVTGGSGLVAVFG